MHTIGLRIESERKRLSLDIITFADKAGVHRNTQKKYESGDRSPDAEYLQRSAGIGVDVLYVLTGMRNSVIESIDQRQRALLDNYEHSDDAGKKIIEGTASLAAQSAQVKKTA